MDSLTFETKSIYQIIKNLMFRFLIIAAVIVLSTQSLGIWQIIGFLCAMVIVSTYVILDHLKFDQKKIIHIALIMIGSSVFLSLFPEDGITDDILSGMAMFLILYSSFSLIETDYNNRKQKLIK